MSRNSNLFSKSSLPTCFERSVIFAFKVEDYVARIVRKYPLQERMDSSPFLSSDSYYFLSDCHFDSRDFSNEDLKKLTPQSRVYVNGNYADVILPKLIKTLEENGMRVSTVVVGDSDFAPSIKDLNSLRNLSDQVHVVNLLKSDSSEVVKFLPLGIESRRYRSAGLLRDFKKIPSFDFSKRTIGVLVAWNDETNPVVRSYARESLRKGSEVKEITSRIPASALHLMMRRSLFVATPAGNGRDTHRFWESLYLGALPVITNHEAALNLADWPYLRVDDWNELASMSRIKLENLYIQRIDELRQFRGKAEAFMMKALDRPIVWN